MASITEQPAWRQPSTHAGTPSSTHGAMTSWGRPGKTKPPRLVGHLWSPRRLRRLRRLRRHRWGPLKRMWRPKMMISRRVRLRASPSDVPSLAVSLAPPPSSSSPRRRRHLRSTSRRALPHRRSEVAVCSWTRSHSVGPDRNMGLTLKGRGRNL